MVGNTAPLFGALPSLTPGELLFAVLVFTAALCVLFNIHPVAILGATLLLMVIMFVDLFGINPFLAVMVILAAALVRLIGTTAGIVGDADPELLAVLASIIGRDSAAPDNRDGD